MLHSKPSSAGDSRAMVLVVSFAVVFALLSFALDRVDHPVGDETIGQVCSVLDCSARP